jgi:hypothetical protein
MLNVDTTSYDDICLRIVAQLIQKYSMDEAQANAVMESLKMDHM